MLHACMLVACTKRHALAPPVFWDTTYGQLGLPWCTHAMQCTKALQVACELAVVHVAEGAAYGLADEAAAAAADAVRAASGAAGYGVPFHSLALEDVFAKDGAALRRACVTEREAFRGDAHANEGRAAAACRPSDVGARGAQAGGADRRECAAREASADIAAAVPASAGELCEQGSGPRPPRAGGGGARDVLGRPSGAASAASAGACGLCEHPGGAAAASGGDGAACAERRERRERLAALLAVRLPSPFCVQPSAPACCGCVCARGLFQRRLCSLHAWTSLTCAATRHTG